ncbi:MAG: hypothetical protein KME08_05915 [Aphanothece sp. CMT-3BRIN-NPC111]|jgi:hypothetical protein|nr:hypothetical protein [Aphanothece sp. CMT-3BRIN-NPC111]
MRFTVLASRAQVNRFLISLVLLLNLLSLIGQFTVYFLADFPSRDTFANRFNVDAEGSLPTVYSGLALLFSSILLALIGNAPQTKIARYARKWKILSWVFLYLSLDELLGFHDLLNKPLRKFFNLSGFFHFSWVIPIGILVVILAISYIKFIFHLPLKVRILFIVAGLVYVFGAIGLEMINGNYAAVYGEKNFTYQLLVTIEEFLEMTGIVIFINALLYYMNLHSINEVYIELFLKKSNN